MITQLKDKFNNLTESRSKKLTILTVLPRSWTLTTIKEEFEASDYTARQAKTLVREKGILSSANCRAGKSLSKDIVNVVQDKSDSVSRIMPGMKGYVSVKRDGVRVHEQKHLAYMSTLRHWYGVSVILASLKTSVPETKISVI